MSKPQSASSDLLVDACYTETKTTRAVPDEVLAATGALGHLFTVNDSTMGAAVKKHLGAACVICSCHQQVDFCCYQNSSRILLFQSNRWQGISRSFSEHFYCASAPPQRVSVLDGQVGPITTYHFEAARMILIDLQNDDV